MKFTDVLNSIELAEAKKKKKKTRKIEKRMVPAFPMTYGWPYSGFLTPYWGGFYGRGDDSEEVEPGAESDAGGDGGGGGES